jgi:hypothetical protein
MRRPRLSKADEEELTRLARAGNVAQQPGLDPQASERAAAVDNERVPEWLGEEEHRPGGAWVWVPPNRERLALVIIARFERHHVDTGNPAFVWAARQVARDILPHFSGEPLQWIETYLDDTSSRMAALIDNPPKAGVNKHIAAALGFDPTPGPGQGSAFSIAQRIIRDGKLAAEVLARLPFENGKEELAIAHVAARNKLGRTTVGNVFRSFKAQIN